MVAPFAECLHARKARRQYLRCGFGWRMAHVVFVADDFVAWLIGALADAGRKKLVALILGSDRPRTGAAGRGHGRGPAHRCRAVPR